MEQISFPELLRVVTESYLDSLDPNNLPTPHDIQEEIIVKVNAQIKNRNDQADKGDKWPTVKALAPAQIASIIARTCNVCRIASGTADIGVDYDMLGIYQTEGANEGIYDTSFDAFRKIARSFDYTLKQRDFEEILFSLKNQVPRRERTRDRDLIAVNNGIFDYATKELRPFSSEFVFTAKSHVDYVPNAPLPRIHNDKDGTDWDPEEWMAGLSDDEGVPELLWQITGAVIRPHVRWNKSAWLYSTQGNNGKGTFCSMLRNLCGQGSYAAIKLTDFGKDFMLEPLTRATSIIVDENDVGTYIDAASDLKAVITNDVITINRKFKDPVVYQFFGFMVQCLNEFPRVKDRSDSFYRRQLFIPMNKWFGGAERKYIKEDYLARPEVLQYILWKVLHMDYYELTEPSVCSEVMEEYQIYNDPIRQFWADVSDSFKWDLLPNAFLFDLYKSWSEQNNPSGKNLSRNNFLVEVHRIATADGRWISNKSNVRTKNMMSVPEPLIAQYNLVNWMSKTYSGKDIEKLCLPSPNEMYRGLVSATPKILKGSTNDDTADSE